jgi:glycosyltransferase involved in cell wall biosynthesis
MKILHVITSVNTANGGPIEGIRQLGGALARQGHLIEIASVDSPSAPWLRECPLPVHPLGPSKLHYGYSNRLVPWLRENRRGYDAVIVNGLWQFHSFASWQALRRTNTPYVVYTHGMLDPWFKRTYPLKHLKKWSYWPWADYRVLRDAQAVLFTCEEERVLARQSFWLYRCNEIVVNYGTAKPSGHAPSQIEEFFQRYPELRDKRIALFMGRIHPKKGCDLLIDAFAKVPAKTSDWHLVIAGPDQAGWEKELRQRAEIAGVSSRITWTGMIGGSLKWGALRAAEILVLPSHQENFGLAVAEALAAGTPTLVSNKVNIWREIEADGAGLVADDTLSSICESFRSYLNLPDQGKIAMREFARRCFEERFEIDKAAGSLQSVLSGFSN